MNKDILECLESNEPSIPFLEKFHNGVFDDLLMEFSQADNIPAGPIPYHYSTVLGHTMRCIDEVAGDPLAVWMALCHDCGKVLTSPEELPHHYNHEKAGEYLAEIWGYRCDMPCNYILAGKLTALLHMRASRYDILTNKKKYNLLLELYNAGIFKQFWNVVSADSKNTIGDTAMIDLDYILKCISENRNAKDIKSVVCEKFKKFKISQKKA